MPENQHALFADNTGEVALAARRALSILAAADVVASKKWATREPFPTPFAFSDLAARLHTAFYSPDPSQFANALNEAQVAGFSNDLLAFELIPAIARQLGAAWESDQISFAEVTIGCARLQTALRQMPDVVHNGPIAPSVVQQDCLVMVPKGAQHTMGALVLAKQLRQARQQVTIELNANASSLANLAQEHDFNVVLVSASRGECPDGLRHLVGVVRQHWAACKVVIGGSICDLGSDLGSGIGANLMTEDWQEALGLRI